MSSDLERLGQCCMEIRSFRESDKAGVIALWHRCGLIRPWNDPERDIARKMTVQPDWFVIVTATGDSSPIIGSAMIGYDGHRGWINYLAVDPAQRRQGIGRALMAHAEQVLCAAGCPKLNLQVRDDNQAARDFYARLGYETDAAVSLGKRLIDDTPSTGE